LAAEPAVFASGQPASPDAVRAAHGALLRDPSLQFSFPKAVAPPQVHLPAWLQALDRLLGQVFGAIGKVLGWVFIGGLALIVAIVVFFVAREIIRTRWPELLKRRTARPPQPADWRPDAAAAHALLEDADRLAAAGRYGEAVRLILHRSIEDIEGRRPRLVRPALTAREIGGLDGIPDAARAMFQAIAAVVERSLFGGRSLDAEAFTACRRAYEAFAFPGAWA
jgi:hypothetical protein